MQECFYVAFLNSHSLLLLVTVELSIGYAGLAWRGVDSPFFYPADGHMTCLDWQFKLDYSMAFTPFCHISINRNLRSCAPFIGLACKDLIPLPFLLALCGVVLLGIAWFPIVSV